MTTITPTTTRNCYFHFDQHKPAVAILNNGQFDVPVCGSCLAVAMGIGYEFVSENTELREGEPCGHPGCLHHITHPCEGCGRIAGRSVTSDTEAAS